MNAKTLSLTRLCGQALRSECDPRSILSAAKRNPLFCINSHAVVSPTACQLHPFHGTNLRRVSSSPESSRGGGRKPGRAGLKRKPLGHLGGFSYPGPRKLADITKLPLLNAHNAQGVQGIWLEYHKHHASAIADTFRTDEFGTLMQRSQRCPLFVVPIPRQGGFFTMISQFQGRQCIVTYLEDYKRDPSNAQPYITLTLFDELLEKKGLALLRAEITNQLTREEGTRYVENDTWASSKPFVRLEIVIKANSALLSNFCLLPHRVFQPQSIEYSETVLSWPSAFVRRGDCV